MRNLVEFFNSQRKEPTTLLFLLIIVVMLLLEYFGWQGPFHNLFRTGDFYRSLGRNERNFYAQVYTTCSFGLLFFVLPLSFHLLFSRGKSSFKENGLTIPTQWETWKPYLLLYLIMAPLLVLASSRPAFYNFYPLYRPADLMDWMKFELVYLPQFIFVEFFFRGFGLFQLEKHYKLKAIIMMTLPYALIHIHKPFGEAVGSIFAGMTLGFLALKGRSILPGIFLHMAVALSADFLGLYFYGFFN